jgi:hypothetical protein
MAKRFDPARLFEPWSGPVMGMKYRSDEAELDAIRIRKKGMSVFGVSVAQARRPEFVEWLELAFERDLVVALHKSTTTLSNPEHVFISMFVSRPEELWRVPAYMAVWDTAFVDGRWSDASENLVSHLLGYTASERKHHIDRGREYQPAWTAGTAFALLTSTQRAVVGSVGRRCFGPAETLDGLVLFVGSGVLRRDAFSRVPEGMTLARVGIEMATFRELFPSRRPAPRLWERTLDAASATILNRGLVSNVQFLTRSGWR